VSFQKAIKVFRFSLARCVPSRTISEKPTRTEWIADRDFTPIEPAPDGALVDYAQAYRKRGAAG